MDHTGAGSVERTDHECDVTSCSIPAHRVIIAARCDWFKRALLSGMRESIDRYVTRIHICQMTYLIEIYFSARSRFLGTGFFKEVIRRGADVYWYFIEQLCRLFMKSCDHLLYISLCPNPQCTCYRKITVHDTDPRLFRQFLEYVYSGVVELNDLSTEQIADMMTLADRYDVSRNLLQQWPCDKSV